MYYRILGRIAVIADDGSVRHPGGRQQRLLLSVLLHHAPRIVPSERLWDVLWADRLPADPAASLRTQISRIRSFLNGAASCAEAVRSEAYGYRLDARAHDTDAGRFEALLQRAQEHDPGREKAALIEEAVRLWQGEPFEEFADLELFAGEIARLRELRLGAREMLAECLLAGGRLREALVSTEALVHEDPLRERPRALMMSALYQLGRQHEALAVFQEYRRLLSEELGLDPSPALRQLEGRMLRHEHPVVSPPTRSGPLPAAVEESGDGASVAARAAAADSSGRREGVPAADRALNVRPIPVPLTRLIGREEELRAVHRLLRSTRMLTLTGAGGSGKTRLAQEVAARVRAAAPHRDVAWIGLEALSDPDLVASEAAAVLGLAEQLDRAPVQRLIEVLRLRPWLLVLDNCEHLIEATASLTDALLRACPNLIVLATSRAPLRISGEVTRPVPPLAIPGEESVDPVAVGSFAAVQLFVERACAAAPTFVLDDTNAAAVAHICRRLDGIPLALELAAARIRVLAPAQIAERLDHRFVLLTGGSRTSLPRHQTLRAAIDWSYELLSRTERRALDGLSVFAGSFDLSAAEAILEAATSGESLLETVAELVDRSLVVADGGAQARRFRLLESVRHYAHERLLERGSESEMQRRHAEHYAALAEQAGPFLLGPHRAAWARRLAADQAEIRAVLAWALGADGEPSYALRIAASLWWFWHYVGQLSEGRRWVERALAVPLAETLLPLRARLLYAAAKSNWMLGDAAAATTYAEEGVALCRELRDDRLLIWALVAHAFAGRDHGDLATAQRSADECVQRAPAVGLASSDVALALLARGSVHAGSADFARARDDFAEAVRRWRVTGDTWGIADALQLQAMAELELGATDRALALCAEAIAALREEDETWFLCRCLEAFAIILVRRGEPDSAARLLGAAEALRESIRAPVLGFDRPRYDGAVAGVRAALGEDAFAAAWRHGRSMERDEAIAHALRSRGLARSPS